MRDMNKEVIVNPFANCNVPIPKIGIACYTEKVTNTLVEKYNGVLLCKTSKTKIYQIKYKNKKILIYTSPVGSPWATMVLEDLISIGLKKIIFFGSCGVLDNIKEFEILIPTKSKREEGTSYHYIKKGKYIDINPKYINEFTELLTKKKINYQLCKTWTIDAPYRETKKKVQKYIKKGIKTVEMESSALATIGIFRNIDVFIFFYAADSLSKLEWEKRCLGNNHLDNKIFYAELALDLALCISKDNK